MFLKYCPSQSYRENEAVRRRSSPLPLALVKVVSVSPTHWEPSPSFRAEDGGFSPSPGLHQPAVTIVHVVAHQLAARRKVSTQTASDETPRSQPGRGEVKNKPDCVTRRSDFMRCQRRLSAGIRGAETAGGQMKPLPTPCV
ncbi:unnamed protein product [Arctogadus glacialis]